MAVIEGTKYYEVTKFLSLTNHSYSMSGLLIGKRALEKLSPDQRKAVVAAGEAATAAQRKVAAADVQQLIKKLEKEPRRYAAR